MAAFLVFVLKSSLALALLVSLFMAFMSRETFHRVNRFILLGIVAVSLMLPSVNLGVESPFTMLARAVEREKTAVVDISDESLMAVAVSGLPTVVPVDVTGVTPVVADEPFDWLALAYIIYLAGVAALLLRQAVVYVQMVRLLLRSRPADASQYGVEEIRLRVHEGNEKPFSWFCWVVVSVKDMDEGVREILVHEAAHVRAGHSWDVLFADAVIMLQWFNPLAWIMKNSLKDIHEFEADEAVINSGVNAKQYQILIIKKAVGARLYSIANSFNHSLTKKRITMMCKEKSTKWRCAKALYILPAAAIVALSFSTAETANATESEKLLKGSENVPNEIIYHAENLYAGDDKENSSGAYLRGNSVDDFINTEIQPAEMSVSGADGDVKPQFPGGMEAMMWYLASNIKYPDDAKSAGKQGKVILTFTVKSDGSIADASVLRSAGHKSLDNEALRVVGTMPKWIPGTINGKAADIKYTLPVVFKLPAEKKDNRIIIGDGSVIVDADVKNKALIVVDGEVYDRDLKELDAASIAHIEVIKNSGLTDELIEIYNAKDKEGIIFITTASGESSSLAYAYESDHHPLTYESDFDDNGSADDENKVFQIVEQQPEYPGGTAAMMKFFAESIRYPADAKKAGKEGMVYVRFTVGKDGSISDAEVLRGSGTKSLDDEALIVIGSMPKWKPGMLGGKPVAVKFTVPVKFALEKYNGGPVKFNVPASGNITDGKAVVVYVDGKYYDGNGSSIEPASIQSMTVVKKEKLSPEQQKLCEEKNSEGILFIELKKAKQDDGFDVVKVADSEEEYMVVEQMPEFPGGVNELMRYLQMNSRYPKEARDINAQGKVIVQFVVMADGSISKVGVVRCDYSSGLAKAVQYSSDIEHTSNALAHLSDEVKQFEQHIADWEMQSSKLQEDGVADVIIERRRDELEKARKHLEESKKKCEWLQGVLEEKKQQLAESTNQLDEVSVVSYGNGNGTQDISERVKVLSAAAEKALCDEAVRLVSSMPKWKPGMQRGKAVNVRFTLPVAFMLK